MVLSILMDILNANGFEALGAARGGIGLELAREHRPDVIVSDYYMPDTNGIAVLAEVRAHPETATIPFVMMSMESGSWLQEKALKAGADAFLCKPFGCDELTATLHALLEKTRRTQRS